MPDADTLQGMEATDESGAVRPEESEPFDTADLLSTDGAEAADELTDGAEHGLSNATLESMSRTDSQAQAVAEAERTKWERRKAFVSERVQSWCKQYMADGGFKLGISLVTAVVAASVIVIAGIFSDRQLGVVFLRALTGFCVSGLFMGGALYWLDRVGIPLFIARHEEQIQMEWLAEAEESESEAEAVSEEEELPLGEGELEELLPQEGDAGQVESEEAAPLEEPAADNADAFTDGAREQKEADEAAPSEEAGQLTENGSEESAEGAAMGEDMNGLENAVLDDAFSSGEAEEETAEPPTFAPMTADNLESLSVPES